MKEQNVIPNLQHFLSSLQNMDVEENVSHTPETLEIIVTELKKQLWETIKELREEITCQVKEEMINVMKKTLNTSKEDIVKKN